MRRRVGSGGDMNPGLKPEGSKKDPLCERSFTEAGLSLSRLDGPG